MACCRLARRRRNRRAGRPGRSPPRAAAARRPMPAPSMPSCPAAGTVTREITLDAGDVLDLSVHGAPGARASVALVGGTGAPQTLDRRLRPAAAVSFKAPQAERLRIPLRRRRQGGSASVSATCTSAQTAAASAAFLARRKDLAQCAGPRPHPHRPRAHADRRSRQAAGRAVAARRAGQPKQVEFSVSLSEISRGTHPARSPSPALVDLWAEGRMQNYDATAPISAQQRQPRHPLPRHEHA